MPSSEQGRACRQGGEEVSDEAMRFFLNHGYTDGCYPDCPCRGSKEVEK